MQKKSIYTRYEPGVVAEDNCLNQGYCFVFCGNKLLIETNGNSIGIPLLTELQELNLSPENTHYLGLLQGETCYVASIPSGAMQPQGMSFQEFKTIFGVLDHDISMLAGRASQIIDWDKTHRFAAGAARRPLNCRKNGQKNVLNAALSVIRVFLPPLSQP